jgi:hypothetical protein
MFEGNANGSVFGGLASGVPGDVRGLETVHQKYGVSAYFPISLVYVHYAYQSLIELTLASSCQPCRPRCQTWISR